MLRHNICANVFRNIKLLTSFASKPGDRFRKTSTAAESVAKHEDPLLATAKPFEDMPTLPSFPIVGSLWVYMPLIGRYSIKRLHHADIHKHQIYGDIMREEMGPWTAVLSYRPEDMEIMLRNEGPYPLRPEIASLKAYRESRKKWYNRTGLVLMNGKEWHDLRSKTQKHLMKPKAILAYLDPLQDVSRDLIKKIYESRDKDKEVPDFLGELYKWGLESVAFVGLDVRLGCLDKNLAPDSDGVKMIESMHTILTTLLSLEMFPIWKYVSTPTWRKFTRAADVFTEIAFKYINNAIDVLGKNQDEDKELTLLQAMLVTKGLDASDAMVNVSDMLGAGIESTSHSVGFLLYNLAKNPEKQLKLYKELNSLLPEKSDKITPPMFHELHFLKCCMKESLRLYPIARGNARIFDHDIVMSGYRVPAGTLAFCLAQTMCRSEKYFKDADQFLPERWSDRGDKVTHPFAYAPFGIGTRSCIGRRLAELKIICIVAEIIRNFKVEYHHEDLDMYTKLGNVPDKPLRFSFIER